MAAVDNPLLAATGHRICNDCMKACIYQKQTPVDIPQAETRTLKDVLELPWGFEIYSLLTRWNPLNLARPLPKADTGRPSMASKSIRNVRVINASAYSSSLPYLCVLFRRRCRRVSWPLKSASRISTTCSAGR